MSIRIRAGRVASLAICLLAGVGGVRAQYTAIGFAALEIDSVYPGVCGNDGCFPSVTRWTDEISGVPRGVLGFTGGTYAAWPAKAFPTNPLGFVLRYATPHTSVQVDYFLDGMDGEGSVYLWFCQMPQTTTEGYSPTVWSDTCWVDYSLHPEEADYSGTHRLFFSQTCGGPGCGDFEEIVILFGDNSAGSVKGTGAHRQPVPAISMRRVVSLATPTGRIPAPAGLTAYDMHGRRIGTALSTVKGVVVLDPVNR